ncbi:MAG: sulfotransferase [Bacteroidota bacterium]
MRRIVYIASAPRSGSTLLTHLIASHPDVGTIGERHFFHRLLVPEYQNPEHIEAIRKGAEIPHGAMCSCGRPFVKCPVWLSILARVEEGVPARIRALPYPRFGAYKNQIARKVARKILWRQAETGRMRGLPWPLSQRFRAMLEANNVLIDAALAETGGSVFLDNSKTVQEAIYLDHHPENEVRVIHLVRDGRAQMMSRVPAKKNLTADNCARQWAETIETSRRVLSAWRGPVLDLRYEDLCNAPDSIMAEVYAFCDLDSAATPAEWGSDEQHVMGNSRMRLSETTKIELRTGWKSKISDDQLRTFEQRAGALNRSLGYSDAVLTSV